MTTEIEFKSVFDLVMILARASSDPEGAATQLIDDYIANERGKEVIGKLNAKLCERWSCSRIDISCENSDIAKVHLIGSSDKTLDNLLTDVSDIANMIDGDFADINIEGCPPMILHILRAFINRKNINIRKLFEVVKIIEKKQEGLILIYIPVGEVICKKIAEVKMGA